MATFPFPEFEQDYEFVALRHADEYPFNEGRIVSNRGLDIAASEFESNVVEEHVAHSNALHAMLRGRGAYFVGPMARFHLNFDRLSPLAQAAAREAGVNEFVIKPFTPAALLSRLQAVLNQPRSFIVSDTYLGPDRRRKAEISYAGPLRRISDPEEVVDVVERQVARETISVELEAMRRLIVARGGVDRATLQMTYRVMQHTRFRARQVRDRMLERATNDLLVYADDVGGMEHCEAEVVEAHLAVLGQILEGDDHDAVGAAKLVRGLQALIRRKRAARQMLAA